MPGIHAYFENMHEARKALKAMMEAGFSTVYLDMSGAYDYEYSVEIAGSATAVSCLPSLVTRSGGCMLKPNSSSLVDAATAVSSLAHTGDSRSICTKLIARVDDDKKETAASIIKQNGGRIFPTFIE